MTNGAITLMERIPQARILCLGDLMLDRYIYGEALRLSPEAPVPIITVRKRSAMPGGLGNVVMNLSALGASPLALGVVGQDEHAKTLKKLLAPELSPDSPPLIEDPHRPTTVKTRIIAGIQQVVRFDEESLDELSPELEDSYRKAFTSLDRIGALAISDYGKGVLSPKLTSWLISEARSSGLGVVVDPKGPDYSRYSGATLVTPNRQELSLALGQDVTRAPADLLAKAGRKIMNEHGLENLLITRSEDGMLLLGANGDTLELPTRARAVFDVSGAGDTVVAVMAATLALGASLANGAELATLAAGVVVGKVGTASANPEEIRDFLNNLHR